MNKTRILFLGIAALALAACGHNSGSDSGVQLLEDAVASASIPALVAFSQAQIARADADASEPRPIGGVNPPVSDVDEPVAI